MAKNHAFGVRGGEKLARMGLAWFISYAYYEKADKSHLAWKKANKIGRASCRERV